MNILILDGTSKNALAVVRHLGRKGGFNLTVAAHKKNSLALLSKYATKNIILPDARVDESAFINSLIKHLESQKYDSIIPVSYISYKVCSQYSSELKKYTGLCITSHENIVLSQNKSKTNALAQALEIPIPQSFEAVENTLIPFDSLRYPVVVKSPLETGFNFVLYAKNKKQCIDQIETIRKALKGSNAYPIVQEYIYGEGVGYFAFYQKGICVTHYMHRRIREYPVTGGSSTCAESFFDEKLADYGQRILDHLKWEGVAMVEFKKSLQDGEFYLMEINGKLWGSLDLALKSEVDFAEYIINASLNKEISKSFEYKAVRFQWLINGELFHLIERPRNFFKIFADLFRSEKDLFWSDLKPNLFQLANVLVHYYKKIFK